ncbi:MAG: hypothetical protein JW966_00550 [Anaerolineae bacterium]|nr:hypothetical protein [Anaerolineae bacterium]
MVDKPDLPGPGERTGPDHIQAEANGGPIPDGEMPGVDPAYDHRRQRLEMRPISVSEYASEPETSERSIRQTGTDLDVHHRVLGESAGTPERRPGYPLEQRVDTSAGDSQREKSLAPVQDDSDPRSDQI